MTAGLFNEVVIEEADRTLRRERLIEDTELREFVGPGLRFMSPARRRARENRKLVRRGGEVFKNLGMRFKMTDIGKVPIDGHIDAIGKGW